MTTTQRKNIPITDLDQSDGQEPTLVQEPARTKSAHKKHRSGDVKRKVLHTISGNFNRRSRSVDCNVEIKRGQPRPKEHQNPIELRRESKVQRHLNEVLEAKNTHMEKLLERLSTLHNYNERFAIENRQLQQDIDALEARLVKALREAEECTRCQRLTQQLSTSVSQNKTLITDVEMMKTLVYRLNVQIERYQDQLRHNSKEVNEDEIAKPTAKSSLPEWKNACPPHTLTPLLQAYDEMIADKEQLVQQYSQEFEHFTGELKRVIEENARLLQSNEALKRDVGTWREERTCLQAQLDVCRAKAEAQTRKTDLAKEKLVEVMHCYEQKTQTLMLDMDHLQAAYARCKSELATLKSVTAGSPQSPDAIATSLQECKELLEQLKQEHDREKEKLQRDIAEQRTCHLEIEEKFQRARQEIAALKAQLDERADLIEELKHKETSLQRSLEKSKHARDRLKARLRITLQWAQKLEAGQVEMKNTYDAVRRLEVVVKHKEAQLRGLHARNIEELDRLQKKLAHKEQTIRTLLREKVEKMPVVDK